MRFVGVPLGKGQGEGTVLREERAVALPPTRPRSVGDSVLWAPGADPAGVTVEELARPCGAILLLKAPTSSPGSVALPTVAGVPSELIWEGDRVKVDGDAGTVELPSVRDVQVVTSLLQRDDGRILILRRSERVGSFRGRWAGVSGYLEVPDPLAQSLTEIHEEIGLSREELQLASRGEPVYARDQDRVFVIHPFRFRVRDPKVRLDWEHTEFRWILPEEIDQFVTVPQLGEVWRRVAPPP